MQQGVSRFVYRYRRVEIVLLHSGLVLLSNYLAFLLRFGGQISLDASKSFLEGLSWLVVIRMLTFIPFRLYEGLWRYTGIWDLRNIVGAVALSTLAFYGWARWGLGLVEYPATALVVDSLLLIFFTGGLRLIRRVHRGVSRLIPEKRVLVYGAGDAGEMIVRDMRNIGFYEYEPMGFIDDNPNKVGRRIHGVKVLGTRAALAHVMACEKVDMVLVSVPRAEPETIRSIVSALEPFKVPILTLPNLRDLVNGRVSVNQIRRLSVEDLLERAPIGLDVERDRALIAGKKVLITGAGGSIGSELSRQIGVLEPAGLVLLDRYENGLHALMIESQWRQQTYPIRAVVGDVANPDQMTALLAAHRPDIVFHAAAHKHVPLMEANACEAVKNNVRGTRIIAETVQRFGVDRFVLISTDKAVNPFSVMGATKRVAELLMQGMSHGTGVCSAVRFGNVLASNGSVVPQFVEQIARGGPVTVTHPDVRRYFMLIPEAVHLVLHAAALAKGGDIFVLEMGEQIRVLDLARNLIRLSGLVPEQDIAITFTGLRPGEKLSEELVGGDEVAEPTSVSGILRVQLSTPPEWSQVLRQVIELEQLAETGDDAAVIERLRELVPTYRPRGARE
jgi:FlaA1/EpsC-like NDP-sugar epimerase